MPRAPKNQHPVADRDSDAEQARYAAAWEASDHPRPRSSRRLAAFRRLARRRSARILMIAPVVVGAFAGAWWIRRRAR
jgi:hypothetical protein